MAPKEYVKEKELKRLRSEVTRLLKAMETAENMARHPHDAFVLVNIANYLDQSRRQPATD